MYNLYQLSYSFIHSLLLCEQNDNTLGASNKSILHACSTLYLQVWNSLVGIFELQNEIQNSYVKKKEN